MKNKVLIIGGAGFIGHNLSIFLKQKNYDVTIVDHFVVNNFISLKKEKICSKKFLFEFIERKSFIT